MEKYKITLIQYLPEKDDSETDAFIVAVAPLPNNLKMIGAVVSMTSIENIIEDQNTL